MTTRAEQKEKRRQDILKAGLSLFVRKGFEATKIGDIAEKANMSVGLLYHYFNSTEDLYEELIGIGLSARAEQRFPAHEVPLDFFVKSAEQIFEIVKADTYHADFFLLISQAQRNPNLPAEMRERLEKNDVVTKSIVIIEECQRQGIIREGNPQSLALAFWLAIQAYVEMIALNPAIPYPEPEWFVDILRNHP